MDDSEAKFLGITVADWMKMVFTFFLGVSGTLFVTWWNTKAAILVYSSPAVTTFTGTDNSFSILGFNISNTGRQEVKDVECSFSIKSVEIKDVKITPEFLNNTVTLEKNGRAVVQIKLINAGDTFRITALTSHQGDSVPLSEISLRGTGVTGNKESQSYSGLIPPWAWLLFFFILGVLSFILFIIVVIGIQNWKEKAERIAQRERLRELNPISPDETYEDYRRRFMKIDFEVNDPIPEESQPQSEEQ